MATVAERAVGAVVGGLVADAAAVPLHWIYDVTKVDAAVGGRTDMEFLPKSFCPFYNIATGRNSCYGHQAFILLESLTGCNGFDKADYKKRLYDGLGPNSDYEGTGDTKTRPVQHPWRNGSIRNFVEKHGAGQGETGADDSQADCFAKAAAIAALYSGRPELVSVTRDVVSVTQNNEQAIEAAIAGVKILEKFILNGKSPNALTEVIQDLPADVASTMTYSLAAKDMDHRAAVKKFGSSCALPGSLQSAVHALVKSDGDYVNTVRMNMVAGGDNCSRLCLVGAVLGAQVGVDAIPADWVTRTNVGQKAKELAQKLVASRPA